MLNSLFLVFSQMRKIGGIIINHQSTVRSHCHWFYLLLNVSALWSFVQFLFFMQVFVFFHINQILISYVFIIVLYHIFVIILVLLERSLFLKNFLTLVKMRLVEYFLILVELVLFILKISFWILILIELAV